VKTWYQSKTVWLNVIGLSALIIPIILDALIVTFPDLGALPVWGGALLAILNVVLRFITTEPIANPFEHEA